MKVTLQILPKIGCHSNVPRGTKKGPDRENSRIWWKDRENRSSRSWDNLSQVGLKQAEINASKIYSPSGEFAERAKL